MRFIALALLVLATAGAKLLASEAARPVDFARDVRPILESHCFDCHSGTEAESDLRLDLARSALDGGNSGPAVVPGKADESLLFLRVNTSVQDERMPPIDGGDPLSAEELAVIRHWIDQGAKVPQDETAAQARRTSDHWAFQPVVRPSADHLLGEWSSTRTARTPLTNPIDAFIAAKCYENNIAPSAEADRVTLIRRLSFDLRGLPPSVEEVDAFVADDRADVYEQLVERLLESPQYGERWARHWLDQARYADSEGYTNDVPRSIWPWRDWVIAALNRDQPFDEFIIDQIAGDLRPNPTVDQTVATGFHRNTQHNREGGSDPEQYRVERLADRVSTTADVLLGLTMGCARCHDHKFDPISQREFYQLYAFFDNSDEPEYRILTPEQRQQREELQQQIAALEKERHELEQRLREQLPKRTVLEPTTATSPGGATLQTQADHSLFVSDEQKKQLEATLLESDAGYVALRKQLDELRGREKQLVEGAPSTLVVQELAEPRTTYIHLRGDFLSRGRQVQPGTPAVLPPLTIAGERPTRMDLARWLVSPKNPLTPRVTVNRLWQAYFGRGLVETDNDFGTQGIQPTHRDLLDWLAAEFVAGGWSLKHMHRLILTSATYRQSSSARPELNEIDPRNLLLARQSRHRLEAEVVRDAALAASGLLSLKIGGASVYPPQPEGVLDSDRTWNVSTGEDRYRRGMYTYFWRTAPYPFLKAFDAPDSNTACTRRDRTNTPLQALMLLNDEVFVEAAQGLAARVLADQSLADDNARLERAFRLCISREPGESEIRRLGELLTAERAALPDDAAMPVTPAVERFPSGASRKERVAWTSVARALLNVDEFITRE